MEINRYNFLRWRKPGDNSKDGIPKPYRIDQGCYAPVLVPGETTSFFINCNFTQDFQFSVRIVKNNAPVTGDLVTLTKAINDYGFELYGSIICPALGNGYYNLGVFVGGVLKLISNPVFVKNAGFENTALVKFRHNRLIYGVNYEFDEEFYQQFRIHISEIDRQYDYNKDQYRSEISGNLRSFHSTTDRYVKFESYYFDDGAHEAIACMVDHDEVYINNERFVFKSGYKPSIDLKSATSKGEFEMWEWRFSSDNRMENTNEVIFNDLGYYNLQMSQNFSRNNCPAGYTTEPIPYVVPANTYFSLISQADANQLAQNDINANGQAFANANGICTPSYFTDADGGIFTDSDGQEFI